MNERPLMYFGHPINFYNTPKEADLVRIIEARFPEYALENPNQRHHQQGYVDWKAQKGNGMQYYFQIVLPKMDAGIFLCFEDRMFGFGVFGEAEFIAQRGNPIWEIDVEGNITTMRLDTNRLLTIEETKKRIYPNYSK